jgi:hypothetical protein
VITEEIVVFDPPRVRTGYRFEIPRELAIKKLLMAGLVRFEQSVPAFCLPHISLTSFVMKEWGKVDPPVRPNRVLHGEISTIVDGLSKMRKRMC